MPDEAHMELWHELARSEERIRQAELEFTLLGWLPTAASWATLERLGLERERHAWLRQRLAEAAGRFRGNFGLP
ncbi:hypothetical protein [Candidatus Viridilinea mediisalina]|uniref:Uncharacterized protein n=1 Tax=Candidatus Viridilinea mediisalina TaxID=2024553 RepID=A0A2A6RE69_9CHLR|nr:hypothetical protein [Candidatus Viridilinea mediisalina]PDW00783.1 hypothetical protein CJ255_20275 [Candidatus Viridilinea mediisalina]